MPFAQVIGHRRLVSLLSRSIQHDSLPPSLLFAGPAGVGKRLTAIAVAQALNCLKGSGFNAAPAGSRAGMAGPAAPALADACGTCATCKRIARGVHPDVPIVEPGDSGAIRIDQVREIVDRAAYR